MRLSIAAAAVAFSASAFAALADDPMGMAMPAASPAAAAPAAADDAPADDAAPAGGLPGLPGIDISAISGLIPKPTEEQKAKAKKVFQYFYPDCAIPCAAAAMTASGFDMTKKNPSALCRSSFSDSFLTCSKSKCTEAQVDRMKVSLRRVCYLNTPQCALGCAFPLPEGGLGLEGLGALGLPGGGAAADADTDARRRRRLGRRDDAPASDDALASDAAPADGSATSPARPACGPFDFTCSCKDDYAKWYTSCLTTSCPNKEDVNHELNTALAICNAIPPACTKECTKSAMTKANCNALEDPECTCSPKVESAFMDCLTSIDCPLSDKAKAISGFNNNCQFTKALLDGLPRIPSALEEMGLPIPPGIPTSVASLKDAIGAAQEAVAGLAGQLTGDSGDKDDDERKKMRIVKAVAAAIADKPTPPQ